jgi:hypothetical protein
MSTHTLQELRDTLDAHAASVHDDPTLARAAAVQGRAHAVRRRRNVAVAGAVAAVVAAVAVVTVLPGDREPVPADRELIGREAPGRLTSLGYTYHFVEGVESGDRPATLRLRPSDTPRLVTWASEADEVVVDTPYVGRVHSNGTDFDDFVTVAGVEGGRWRIRARGEANAIAVYELGDERPEGLTVDGITFREQVADGTLGNAVIGEEGESDLTLEITLPEGGLRVAKMCAGLADDYTVNVEVEDRGVVSSGGCDDDAFDPGVGSASLYDPGELGRPGETVRVRTWISRRHGGPPVAAPGARLGLAAYDLAPPVGTVAGWAVPELYEYDGHLWRVTDLAENDLGGRRFRLERDFDRPTLVISHVRGLSDRGSVMIGDGIDGTLSGGGAASSGEAGILGPGPDRFPITVRRGLTERTQVGVSLYERVD